MHRRKIMLWIVLPLLTLALIVAAVLWQRRTYHLLAVHPGVLYRSGFQDVPPFVHGLDQFHVKTVVSLIDASELADPAKPQFAQEQRLLESKRIAYRPIPVTLGGWPTSSDIQKFLAIVTDANEQPVLVHCAQGVRRTGMFVAAYEMSVLHYDRATAKAAMQSFGHSARTTADIEKFIDIYDPAKREVTEQPPMGKE